MKPSYDFEEFKNACGSKNNKKIIIARDAVQTARNDFRLETEKSILTFIADDGLEKPKFIHSNPWEKNPKPESKIMVDSYDFYSGSLYGYIAFMFINFRNNWMIKSFKKNTKSDPRNMPFQDLDKKLRLN